MKKKISINYLTDDFIKNIQYHRITDMHLANHGPELGVTSMENILKVAKEMGPFISKSEEWKDND